MYHELRELPWKVIQGLLSYHEDMGEEDQQLLPKLCTYQVAGSNLRGMLKEMEDEDGVPWQAD